MKVIKVTKEYFETDNDRVYFFKPLENEISVDDVQKILDAKINLLFVSQFFGETEDLYKFIQPESNKPQKFRMD